MCRALIVRRYGYDAHTFIYDCTLRFAQAAPRPHLVLPAKKEIRNPTTTISGPGTIARTWADS